MAFIRWLWSDVETMKPVGGPICLSDDQARHWFGKMINPGSPTDCYRLIFNDQNEPVGEISFHRLNFNNMTAEFNIKIASIKQGRGYAKKAMIVFLDFFFNQFGGNNIIDDLALGNDRGQKVLVDFGFEHDPSINTVFRLRMSRERFNSLYGFHASHLKKTSG